MDMKIIIKPTDIVKRCLYDNWAYYILGSEKEAERLLVEDKEFEMSERDALIIGLLKIIETDNLIHRFNQYVIDYLTNKSFKYGDSLYVKLKNIEILSNKFLDKFPDKWSDIVYKKPLEDLKEYVNIFNKELSLLDTIKVDDNYGEHICVSSNSIKKILNFNN